ncbi:MAG: tRNA (adenosine(37)-N6)-dimethylallyltransferase MiaA [Planctomycetota bacterium]
MSVPTTRDVLDHAPLRFIVGPTASGKTALALALCERLGAEVVSLDSMLVYRGLDIGTAKPTAAERAAVPHHMLDLVEPSERFDVQRYLNELRGTLADLERRRVPALLVGGTGFYLAAVLRGLFEGPPVDPEVRAQLERRAQEVGPEALHAELSALDPVSAARLHPNDVRRVVRALEVAAQTGRTLSDWQREWGSGPGPRETRARLIGLEVPTDELDRRIRARTAAMLDAGWREEALRVRSDPGFGPSAIQALGYPEVLAWADGAATRAETEALIALRTRQFARRQRTWYRKFAIHWLPVDAPDLVERACACLDPAT